MTRLAPALLTVDPPVNRPLKTPGIKARDLPYVQNLATRLRSSIDLLVIHCTELPDLTAAREYGERIHYPDSETGNSGHFYIERNGNIEQWVPVERIAHHIRRHNERSIGIELVNRGRFPGWFDSSQQDMTEPYSAPQISSLIVLLQQLISELPTVEWITGHQNLDTSKVTATDDPSVLVFRKRDPGALFPWTEILSAVNLKFLTGDKTECSQ